MAAGWMMHGPGSPKSLLNFTRYRGPTLKAGDRSDRKSTVCGRNGRLPCLVFLADALPIISSTGLAPRARSSSGPAAFIAGRFSSAFASKRKD
jgi:hypothetical protein